MKKNSLHHKAPLAYRIRPRSFSEFIGQERIVSENSPLMAYLRLGHVPSIIIYGPPGSGKTTLAYLIADSIDAEFYQLSAVESGVKEVRNMIETAKINKSKGRKTILFIDEIHRFNKAQQDALLPSVESGEIILIGATTENPFFEIIRPLLSRCMLLVLEPLSDKEIEMVLKRALVLKDGLNSEFVLSDEAMKLIIKQSNGDARRALNLLEAASNFARKRGEKNITVEDIKKVLTATTYYYDKSADLHYDFVSAFIKSLRSSDPDAALVYMIRMIESGEDPKFIARRMIIFASEDIGNADPLALLVANAAFDAVERVGLPECLINLSHAVTYLASSPKSNASYLALTNAQKDIKENPSITVPLKLRNSHYPGAKLLGHGVGYKYPHEYKGHFYPESLMPEELKGKIYYKPTSQGFEKKIQQRLAKLREMIIRKESED